MKIILQPDELRTNIVWRFSQFGLQIIGKVKANLCKEQIYANKILTYFWGHMGKLGQKICFAKYGSNNANLTCKIKFSLTVAILATKKHFWCMGGQIAKL